MGFLQRYSRWAGKWNEPRISRISRINKFCFPNLFFSFPSVQSVQSVVKSSRIGATLTDCKARGFLRAEKGKGGLELPPSQRERGVASSLRLETDRARGPTLHHRGGAATLQSPIRNRQFAIRNVMGRIIAWVGKSTLRTVGSIFWSKIGGWTSIKPL